MKCWFDFFEDFSYALVRLKYPKISLSIFKFSSLGFPPKQRRHSGDEPFQLVCLAIFLCLLGKRIPSADPERQEIEFKCCSFDFKDLLVKPFRCGLKIASILSFVIFLNKKKCQFLLGALGDFLKVWAVIKGWIDFSMTNPKVSEPNWQSILPFRGESCQSDLLRGSELSPIYFMSTRLASPKGKIIVDLLSFESTSSCQPSKAGDS